MGACVVALVGGREENHSTTGAVDFLKTKWVDVTLSANYAAGGDTCDISALDVGNEFTAVEAGVIAGRPTITDEDVIFRVITDPAAGDPALILIHAVDGSTGAEMAPAADLSGEVIRIAFAGN